MEYIGSLLWLAFWPLVIFLSYKFTTLNFHHYQKMERLEELEKRIAQEES